MLILFLIWLYVGWLIVLAGAQVAYYHQYPSVYLLHLRQKHQTPLFREYLTLAILSHITRRFLRGKLPLKEEHLARIQRVPLTIVETLINDLMKAHILIRTVKPKAVMLAKPPDQIAVVDVLKVVQHQAHHGSGTFSLGTDRISQLLQRRDAAVEGVLEGTTLRELIANQPVGSVSDEEWEKVIRSGFWSVRNQRTVDQRFPGSRGLSQKTVIRPSFCRKITFTLTFTSIRNYEGSMDCTRSAVVEGPRVGHLVFQ